MTSLICHVIQQQNGSLVMQHLLDELKKTGKCYCEYPPDSFYWTGDLDELWEVLNEHKKWLDAL